jgi:hypothetical protein
MDIPSSESAVTLRNGANKMVNRVKKTTYNKLPSEKLQVLDLCQLIFKHAEEFYLNLSEIHPEHTEIARMWSLLAIDKCNHSDTYKFATRLKGDGIKEVNIAPEMAVKILSKMKSIPKSDRSNAPSVVDALKFTIKMEEILNKVHFRQVVEFFSEQDTSLMISSLKSSGSIVHMMTEEYLSLTVLGAESFDDLQMDTGLTA